MGLFDKEKNPKDVFYNADVIEDEKEEEFPTIPIDQNKERADKLLKELKKEKEKSE